MKKFIKSMLNHKIIILLISLMLLLFGIYSYNKIPKQEMPDINLYIGVVQVVMPGYSSDQVQQKAVEDIEEILSSYDEVSEYTSTAYDNVAITRFELNLNTKNAVDVFNEIETEILNENIDDAISSIEIQTDFDVPEVIYAVYSDEHTVLELESVAYVLASQLKDVDNVQKTKVNSPYDKQVVVEIDYDYLDQTPLTVADINNIIAAKATELPLGSVNMKNDETGSIVVNSKFTNIDDIEDVLVYADETREYLLKDVADIRIEDADDKTVYSFDGEKVVFVEMYFEEGIDFVKLGNQTKEKVKAFEEILPQGVSLKAMVFSPDYVKDQVNQVIINLLQCMFIVMLVVLIGLGVRNALVIAITIPVIVLTTLGILYYTGNSLQLMTIAGLIVSIGILVDNAIVISEAVQHNIDTGMARKEASVQAVVDNYLPVLTSTLTTVAAFIPLLTLPGIAGEVVFSLPLTILIAISLSFITAMILTPVLASMLFKKSNVTNGKKPLEQNEFLSKGIKFLFKLSILPTVICILLLAGIVFYALNKLEINILPKPEKSVIYIDYEYGKINDNEGALKYAKAIESVVVLQDDVDSYSYSQGGNLPRFDMTTENVDNLPQNGRFFIDYDCEPSELVKYMDVLNFQLKPLMQYGSYSVKRIELSGSDAPVIVDFKGEDLDQINHLASNVYEKLHEIESFDYGELKIADDKVDFELELDDDQLKKYGLTVVTVQQQIAQAVNAQKGEFYESGDQNLDIVVKTNVESSRDLLDIDISTMDGRKIPLKDLSRSNEILNLEYIQSINGNYSATIDAYMMSGYSTYNLQGDIEKILESMDMGDVKVKFGGENEITNEVFGGLGVALAIALMVIYLIMYFQFKSFIQPLIIFISIPLSFIGSFLALIIMNEFITLTGLLGLVSLVGIVVNNGILLVENINRLRKDGLTVYDSCLKATNRRLRPILITSATTILGLVPLALFGGDFFRPMAVSFMGGLMVSTVLVLFMVPSLYYLMYKNKDKAI